MAFATVEHVRDFLKLGEGVSDSRITLLLETAKEVLAADGISSEHSLYRMMQTMYVGYLIEADTSGGGGKIASKTVGDISISYDRGSVNTESLSYKGIYDDLKVKALGLTSRIG